MKKHAIIIIYLMLCLIIETQAQWQPSNSLTDLNTWSSQSGFINWYSTNTNTPTTETFGTGIQLSLPQDPRYGVQIVLPTFDNQIYYRRNQMGTWDAWNKIWSSTNLNRQDVDFNCKNLYANGNLWAKEIKVAISNPWPDYVFKPSYILPSLKDVKSFIDSHHHLADMPSEDQVIKEGLNLGEMDARLLKKVEELTLYLIEKDNQIEAQKAQLDKLSFEFNQMKEIIKKLEK